MAADLKELIDRQAILDCMRRYCRGVDRRDDALIRSVYHPDALDDHGAFLGGREEFIEWGHQRAVNGPISTQHHITNHSCEIDGDTAHAETYYFFVGTDREPPNHLTLAGGRYVDRLERRDGRWAIVDRVCVAEWNAESTSLITEEVIAMLPDVRHAAHGPDDPSYARPLTVARSATPSATS